MTQDGARVVRATAHNFRNYELLDLPLESGWTVLGGPNGAGKTNVLELLTLGLRGATFRGSKHDLFRHGTSEVALTLTLSSGDLLETHMTMRQGMISQQRLWNGSRARISFSDLPSIILFLPEDDYLLLHTAGKRKLISRALLMLVPAYAAALRTYQRLLSQRNGLLRQTRASPYRLTDTAEYRSWTEMVFPSLECVWRERLRYVEIVNRFLPGLLTRLGGLPGGLTMDIRLGGMEHASVLPSQAEIDARFHELQSREIEQGRTLIGPHRDEITFRLGQHDALSLLSRGQRRLLLLALHLLEAELPSLAARPSILYALDDAFSELDHLHREAIRDVLAVQQVVLTTADPHLLPSLPPKTRQVAVRNGTVT